MKKKWQDLTPEQRRKKWERIREMELEKQLERKRLAKKKRKQPSRPEGRHVFEKNKDDTYRCLTCLKGAE